jgi:predicted alpha/beta hydrolase
MQKLLQIWSNTAEIARALALPYQTVMSWNQRGVPARRYRQIIAAAARAGHTLTFEDLAGSVSQSQSEEDAA